MALSFRGVASQVLPKGACVPDILSSISEFTPQTLAVVLVIYVAVKVTEFVVGNRWVKIALGEKKLYDALGGEEFTESRIELKKDINRRISAACKQRSFLSFIWHNCGATRLTLIIILLVILQYLSISVDWSDAWQRLSGLAPKFVPLLFFVLIGDVAIILLEKVFAHNACARFANFRKKARAMFESKTGGAARR